MNENSPIRQDTARAYPPLPPRAPVRRSPRALRWMLVLLALGLAGAYAHRSYEARQNPEARAAQAPAGGRHGGGKPSEAAQAVGVASVTRGDMPVVLQGLGTVSPLATVTMRSQVSGYLTEIGFREGQYVKKDDFLARVDPRPFEALLAQYQGQLARDQALLQNARLDLQRYQTLNRQDSISRQNVDTQGALVKQYEGTVAASQALVDQQRLNIVYTRIVAPVAGRVGLRQVDLGNYISAATTNIVVVTQIDPISVVFMLPEDEVARIMRRVREGAKLTVRAFDRGDQHEIASGMLDTIDNQIDVTTGTVRLRAMFENADERLFPNQFVNARLTVDTIGDAPIVPTAAILRGSQGTYVYLMQGEDKVAVRPVTVGESDGPRSVVLAGLEAGDRVVVDGTDRLREGAQVRITGDVAPQAALGAAAGPGSLTAGAEPGAARDAANAAPTAETQRRRGRPRPQP